MSEDSKPPDAAAVARDLYLRRIARAIGVMCVFLAVVFLVEYFVSARIMTSLDELLTCEGMLLAAAGALLRYWWTGQDPKGFSKPLFGGAGKSEPPAPAGK